MGQEVSVTPSPRATRKKFKEERRAAKDSRQFLGDILGACQMTEERKHTLAARNVDKRINTRKGVSAVSQGNLQSECVLAPPLGVFTFFPCHCFDTAIDQCQIVSRALPPELFEKGTKGKGMCVDRFAKSANKRPKANFEGLDRGHIALATGLDQWRGFDLKAGIPA